MKNRRRKLEPLDISDKGKYYMCRRKSKMKSGEASRKAHRYGHRKYDCPICGHWHLTSLPKDDE